VAEPCPYRFLIFLVFRLRADRIHEEAQASGGNPLQLAHLFGVSDQAAVRYCAELGPPGQAGPQAAR
jgi:hypothetical protein